MAEKSICNDMRTVAINNLIEKIARVNEWIRAIPTSQDVGNEPDSLASIFGSLKLLD
jgi:hypothetical protein